MTDLTTIQKEIVTALEQMKEKSLITEANLAKKVRENAKISGKNKAGICLKDLELCIEYLGENAQLPYALHLNSANDILIKKVDSHVTVFFCCYDNCFLKCADEPAHILIMINFFCIPILSLHKVYLHEQYGKESTHKEIYRT